MPLPAWLLPTVVGAAGSFVSNMFSARQAERLSSTAHQREVKDLRAAGLNPMLSANRGASVPTPQFESLTEGAQRGVSSALAAKQAEAQVDLLKAQASQADAAAALTRQQQFEMATTLPVRSGQMQATLDVTMLDAEQRRQLLPLALERAKEELRLTMSSADRARAAALLDEFAASGAANVAEFEKRMGEIGPAVRFFLTLLRGSR